MPVAAIATIVAGSVATDALVGGLMMASGAMSLVGQVTGNKTLSTLGAVAGVGAGVAGLAGGGFFGEAAQGAEQSASNSFSSIFSGTSSAPADSLTTTASGAPSGDITQLASDSSAGAAAPPPGSFSASITDPSQGLLGSNMGAAAVAPPATASPVGLSAAPPVGGAAGAPNAAMAAGAPDAASDSTGITGPGSISDATTQAGAGVFPGSMMFGPGTSVPVSVGSTGNSLFDAALKGPLNPASSPGVLSSAYNWFKGLPTSDQLAVSNFVAKGFGAIGDFVGPRSTALLAQARLANAQAGIIGAQQANIQAMPGPLVPATTYTRS